MTDSRGVSGLSFTVEPNIKGGFIALVMFGSLFSAMAASAQESSQDMTIREVFGESVELDPHGASLYDRECAACHGVAGGGDGPGAYILSQKPRNFQLGVFKIRSTPSGEYPTDQDLFNTLTRGIAGATGSMMPSFVSLSEADRWSLVDVVKSLALIDVPGTPIDVPDRPASNPDHGSKIYIELECNACHGLEGLGDGGSSLTLEDDLKERVWAPDLTRGEYKGGDTPEDIYTRIVTGLDGSPMPAYAGKASDEDLWALTDYVMSMIESEPPSQEPGQ